jgi:hypothetical protein
MRFSPLIFASAIAVFCAFPLTTCAQDASRAMARAAARHDLELAKIELRLYMQVEYPRQRRHLDAQIKLTQAEVDAYNERLREYRAFDRFSTGRPLLVPMQDLRLCLLEAELRLNDLQAERNALVRFHSDQWRILELKVEQARWRLAELEGGDEIFLEEDTVAKS